MTLLLWAGFISIGVGAGTLAASTVVAACALARRRGEDREADHFADVAAITRPDPQNVTYLHRKGLDH